MDILYQNILSKIKLQNLEYLIRILFYQIYVKVMKLKIGILIFINLIFMETINMKCI
ncbi:hypothetical protein BCR36DRAFT_579822 [Piromyces finnis]|uniref:Uncharacterized protein n=1 Tax=Piromyces finnis TaxID=1754191 RepID=A0A1Y1VL70_9FUNG|nr:hypothetical protein BCR36DRAFT_579822 [Piromyces finnis]|eukprot:ORX59201.1 hypothetical protein BCR36DRAFT_579822 [Piromyces finnis]